MQSRRIIEQPVLCSVEHANATSDKQLLPQSTEESAQISLSPEPNASRSYEIWKHRLGNKQLRHAALVVRCCCSDKPIHCFQAVSTTNLQVAPIWFSAQLTFNFSLSMTNVTSNTILSSTSSLFTYGFSCVLLGEKYTKVKLLSILICIAGEDALLC